MRDLMFLHIPQEEGKETIALFWGQDRLGLGVTCHASQIEAAKNTLLRMTVSRIAEKAAEIRDTEEAQYYLSIIKACRAHLRD